MQSTISTPNFFTFVFLSLHKHNPNHLLPVLEVIAFIICSFSLRFIITIITYFDYYYFCFKSTVPQKSKVSCHLRPALYAALQLKCPN